MSLYDWLTAALEANRRIAFMMVLHLREGKPLEEGHTAYVSELTRARL